MVIRTSLRPLGKGASNLVALEWFNGLTLTYPDEPQMSSEFNADHINRSIYNPYMQMWEDTLRGRFLSTGQNTYNCRQNYYIDGKLNKELPDNMVQFRSTIKFKGSSFTANSSNDEEAIDSAEMISNFNYLEGNQLTFTSSKSPVTISGNTPRIFGPVYEPVQKHWYSSIYYADSGFKQINLRTSRDSSSNPEQWVLMKRAYISGISGFSGNSQLYGPFRNNASMIGVIGNRLNGEGAESNLSENNGLKSGGSYTSGAKWASQETSIKLYLHKDNASTYKNARPWSCSYHYVKGLLGAFCIMPDCFTYYTFAHTHPTKITYAKVCWSGQTSTQNIDGVMSTNQTFWDSTNEEAISIYAPWAMNGSTPNDRFLAVRADTHELLSLNWTFTPSSGNTIPNNRLSFTNTGRVIADDSNKVMSLHSMINYLLVQRYDYSIRLVQFNSSGLGPNIIVYKEFKPIFDGSSKWAVIGFFRNYVYFVQINNDDKQMSNDMDNNKIALNSKICRVSMYDLMKKD